MKVRWASDGDAEVADGNAASFSSFLLCGVSCGRVLAVMKQHTTSPHDEMLSALVDGQLACDDCSLLLSAVEHDHDLLKKWNSYQLIGDALRSSEAAGESVGLVFVEKFHLRLLHDARLDTPPENEPVDVQSPLSNIRQPSLATTRVSQAQTSANDGSFRWKAVAGLASLVAVGAVAWGIFGAVFRDDLPQLAQGDLRGNEQVVVASPQGPIVRDVRLEELLAAHRQLGSTSAVQMPSGFFRNTAFEAPQSAGR